VNAQGLELERVGSGDTSIEMIHLFLPEGLPAREQFHKHCLAENQKPRYLVPVGKSNPRAAFGVRTSGGDAQGGDENFLIWNRRKTLKSLETDE
jgi:hypothetical protein